jgi:hypothetical protein
LGAPESVQKVDEDSTRLVPYYEFDVVLTPEPSRIDYHGKPEVLREWMWLIFPVRWGYPSVKSVGSELGAVDVGNRAPFGPAYNPAWNRTAPGLHYPAYHPKKIPFTRSFLEDLLQPWYYLYIFRTPRYADDARGGDRKVLERFGLLPRGGWDERGVGSPILGMHIAIPNKDFSEFYDTSIGIFFWRNLFAKLRFGAIELVAGYQKFSRSKSPGGPMFIYPFLANLVLRTPDARVRLWASIGGGLYGWQSRLNLPDTESQLVYSGWNLGWVPGVGFEYYLRPKVALDVGLRYHVTGVPVIGDNDGENVRFFALWIGHYIRF